MQSEAQPYVLDAASLQLERDYVRDYAELKHLIKDAGLMDRQGLYYAGKVIEVMSLFGIGVAVLLLVNNPWIQMLNAIYMGVIFAQFGFMMHDGGHRAVFVGAPRNQLFGNFFANLMLGISLSEWQRHHNAHHAHPNELSVDPSFEPLLAWAPEEAEGRTGLPAFIAKYQKYLLLPMMMLLPVGFRIDAFKHLFIRGKALEQPLEALFFIGHFAWFVAVLIASPLTLGWAIAFAVIVNLAAGLFLGMAFAPNHKGMPVLHADHKLPFLYAQNVTTRNVTPSPLVDWFYGGLNYQVEHHLFPGLPRCNQGATRAIVKPFCEERNIPYYETGFIQSWKEIFEYMDEMGEPLRFDDFKG